MNDDERLQEAFHKLREHDARRAPTFEAVRDRPRVPRRSPWALVVPLTSVATAAAVFVWCNLQRETPDSFPRAIAVAASPDLAKDTAKGSGAAPGTRGDARRTTNIDDAKSTRTVLQPLGTAPLDFLLAPPLTAALSSAPNFDTSFLQGEPR